MLRWFRSQPSRHGQLRRTEPKLPACLVTAPRRNRSHRRRWLTLWSCLLPTQPFRPIPSSRFARELTRTPSKQKKPSSTFSVTDGTHTITLPILWSFGQGSKTWVFEREGNWYEGLVSYYPALKALDTTIGDGALTPQTLDEAVGRKLLPSETKDCFGCHSTGAVRNETFNPATLQPGVTCEHCHQGANAHLLDALQGQFDSAPPKLKNLSSEDISSFCGQCHRTWEAVVRNHWRGVIDVRFQPYRLANSKCFNGTDPRISCLACHDPHQDLVRQDSTYDSKCLACHGSAAAVGPASSVSTAAPKSCPVSKSECVSCHMPKIALPGGHVSFTDHEIRVVKAGDAYPN